MASADHAEAIRLNDLAHERLVSTIAGSHSPDPQLRQLLMQALEAAEVAGGRHPKAHPERAIALVQLDLFTLASQEPGHEAYLRAIQDALDAIGQAFDGSPSESFEISRLATVWYTLGFQQQALGLFQDAVGLYQLAAKTGMAVAESDRDVRLLILVGTNIATCADKLGMDDMASRTRAHVEALLKMLGDT